MTRLDPAKGGGGYGQAMDILLRFILDKESVQKVKDSLMGMDEAVAKGGVTFGQLNHAATQLGPKLEENRKQADELQKSWWRTQRELRAAQFTMTAIAGVGAAITVPMIAMATKWASEMEKAGATGDKVYDRWSAAQQKLKTAQLAVGRATAEVLLPALEKVAQLAIKGAEFVEKHPDILKAALTTGAVLVAVGTLGTLLVQGVKFVVDLKFVAASLLNKAAADLMLVAAKANMEAAVLYNAGRRAGWAYDYSPAGGLDVLWTKLGPILRTLGVVAAALAAGSYVGVKAGNMLGRQAYGEAWGKDRTWLEGVQEAWLAFRRLVVTDLTTIVGIVEKLDTELNLIKNISFADELHDAQSQLHDVLPRKVLDTIVQFGKIVGETFIGLVALAQRMGKTWDDVKARILFDISIVLGQIGSIMSGDFRLIPEAAKQIATDLGWIRNTVVGAVVDISEGLAVIGDGQLPNLRTFSQDLAAIWDILKNIGNGFTWGNVIEDWNKYQEFRKKGMSDIYAQTNTNAFGKWIRDVLGLGAAAKESASDIEEAARTLDQAKKDLEGAKILAKLDTDLLKLAHKYADDRLKIEKDLTKDLAKAAKDLAKQLKDIDRDLSKDLAKIDADYANAEQKAAEDLAAKEKEELVSVQEDIQKLKRDHLKKMRELEQEHADKVWELAVANDALGLVWEERRYQREVSNANQDLSDQIAERRRESKQKIAEMRREFALEAAQRKRDYLEKRQEAIDEAAEKRLQAKLDYQEEIKQMQENTKERLAELQREYEEERKQKILAAYEDIVALGGALRTEQEFKQTYYQAMLEDAQAFAIAYKAALDRITATTPPTGTGVTGTTNLPTKAEGGYVGAGVYRLHPNEFVMTAATTRAGEQIVGGQLTQSRLMAALAGGGRASITLNDHRRFDSRLSVSDRRQIEQWTLETVQGLLS